MLKHFRSRNSKLAVAIGIAVLQSTSTAVYAADTSGSSALPDSATMLEEIIVSARKKDESQQDVPSAIAVLSADSLDAQVVLNVQDLGEHVPGLVVASNPQGGAPTFAIRSSKQDNGTDGGVAVYVDDMPVVSTLAIADSVYDLASVAVLKGPQGTLFGVNTTGGAIIFRPNKPTKEFAAYVDAGYGNYNRREVEGMINVPINDMLQVRFAGNFVRRDGFVTNLTPVAGVIPDKLSDDNHESGRLSVRFTPNEDLTNDLVADYYHRDNAQRAAILEDVLPNSTLTAASIRDNKTVSLGGNPSGIDIPNYNKATVWGVYDTLKYQLTDSISLKNTLGYRKDDTDASDDNDGTNLHFIGGRAARKNTLLVEEFSVNINADAVRYSGGLYYQRLKREEGIAYNLGQNNSLAGAFNGLGFPPGSTVVVLQNSYFKRDLESKALYSQADIDLSSELTLTLGARYTWDSGDYEASVRSGALPFGLGVPDASGNFFAGACVSSGLQNMKGGFDAASCKGFNDGKWSAPSFNIALTDKFSDKSMIYFKVAAGYQSGGFNNQFREVVFQTFEPEKTIEFEAGMKSEWELFGRPIRTNVDGFYGNSRNKQEVQNGSYADRAQWIGVFNAGALRYYGSDLEVEYVLLDGLKLSSSWTHVEASYDSFRFPAVGVVAARDLTGTQPAQVPKDTVTATLNASWPLPSSIGRVSSAMTFFYRSNVSFVGVPNFNAPSPLVFSLPASSNIADVLHTYNFSTDWKGMFGTNVDLGVWVKNVFDKEYVAFKSAQGPLGYSVAYYADPRTYGMHVRYTF